ncbi:MAG: hypothetical protein ACE5JF_10735 [Anaerolineales bacterium]
MFETSSAWKTTYPGASVGVLVMSGVTNPQHHPGLLERKKQLEQALRARYASHDRAGLKTLPVLAAYGAYYKQFKKTYHVQHQLESIVFKQRDISSVAALIEAMFMAELKNLLLTAGHDLNRVDPPLRIDVSQGTESYIRMNGEQQVAKERDMMIVDNAGILSSILYGPDRRTRIKPQTERVIFTVYAPPGIEEKDVQEHLGDIQENVNIIAPQASVELLQTFGTS